MESKYTIYVLLLEDNKYYVGKTKNLTRRIDEHKNDQGSSWTKKYKLISVIETIEELNSLHEDLVVKLYMKKYGIDNVRGGTYSGLYLSKETISFLEKEIYHSDNLCFNCKTHGHYSNQCHLKKKTKVIPYTENNITENNITENNITENTENNIAENNDTSKKIKIRCNCIIAKFGNKHWEHNCILNKSLNLIKSNFS